MTDKLEEGFYECRGLLPWTPYNQLCYVSKVGDKYTASFPNGKSLPICTPSHFPASPFLVHKDLTPLTEKKIDDYIKNSQSLIRFIFINLGRLEQSRREKEGKLVPKVAAISSSQS